jgi:YesN/AraC family two-component response regulator
MEKDYVSFNEEIRVLIVDDDKRLCEVLEDIFAKEETLKIFSVHNGIEAIEKINESKFDLILTDLKMPGANGIEVLKAAKEVDESIHVIIITGFASLETAMEAIKKGAYDYITKPFKLDEIKIVINNACEKIRLVRENHALVEYLKQAYQELDTFKKTRDTLSICDDKINTGIDTLQETIEDRVNWLQTLSDGLPPTHYLRRRRSDKGHVLIELEKLGKLRDKGILNEEEFLACKNRFISQI